MSHSAGDFRYCRGMDEPLTVLVVEDDPPIAGQLVRGLKRSGYDVVLLTRGDEVVQTVRRVTPAAVILDLMLPGAFGLDILVALREFTTIPVLVLTARTTLDTRVDSFRRGATDFIAKPYFFEELLVRLEARLGDRRRDPPVRFADVEVDLAARRVRVAGHDAGLTRAELDILLYLVSRAGTAVARERIAEHAIATENDRTERAADVHVSRLRRKLGRGADHLCTVRGFGYRLDLVAPNT